MYDGGKADDIYAALHNFVPGNADDDKAAIILSDIIALGSARLFLIFYYYEGEEPPTTGSFAQFLNIDSTLDTTKTQSYSELVSRTSSVRVTFTRVAYTAAVEVEWRGSGAVAIAGLFQGKHT